MEPIRNITQKELREVINNPVDQAGNKIKLRNVSHENLMKHLKNIPYYVANDSQIQSSKIDLPKVEAEWKLLPKENMDFVGSARKPINVKESMLENIKKHSEVVDVKSDNLNQLDVSLQADLSNSEVVDVKNIGQETSNDNSVDNYNVEITYEEINNIRQQVLNKKEEADQAQREADESDKAVQEIGLQYTEVQKQLLEARVRNDEVKKKVVAALSEQSSTLAIAKKQFESLIEDARRRKEENQNKIAEISPLIKNVEEETISLNNDTARSEEFLNAIYSNNLVDFPYVENTDEEKVRKIA